MTTENNGLIEYLKDQQNDKNTYLKAIRKAEAELDLSSDDLYVLESLPITGNQLMEIVDDIIHDQKLINEQVINDDNYKSLND